jgi:hypothetical protein
MLLSKGPKVKFSRPAVIIWNPKICHTNHDTSASIFISWCIPCCWSVSCFCRSVLLSAYTSSVENPLAWNLYSRTFQRKQFIVDMSHHAKWIRKVNKAIQQHRRQVDNNFLCLVAVAFCTQWAGFTRTAVRSVIQLKVRPNQYPYRQCCHTGMRHKN